MWGMVLQGLREGVSELQSPFDRRSKWTYAFIALQIGLATVLMLAMGYSISPDLLTKLPFAAIPLAASGMLLRRYGHPQTGGALEVLALTYLQGIATIFVLFPLTELSFPFADDKIAAVDAALGFHWPSFAAFFAHERIVYDTATWFYETFEWQAIVIVPALFWFRQETRAWRFVAAAALAGIATVLIYPFIPAQGPCVHYGLERSDFPLFTKFPWQFGPALEMIRADQIHVITPQWIFGMVSVPSYHTVAALLFAWAMWPVRQLRWVFVVLNMGMLVGTVVVGVHYLADIVAGVLLGAGVIRVVGRIVPPSLSEALIQSGNLPAKSGRHDQ